MGLCQAWQPPAFPAAASPSAIATSQQMRKRTPRTKHFSRKYWSFPMKTTHKRIEYTPRAREDLRQARHFLRRHAGHPRARMREILQALRSIRDFPKLRPVEGLSLMGLELRCRRAGKFVIVYSYFEPAVSDPGGFVSVRAIRHVAEEDVRFGVEEHREGSDGWRTSCLILK